MINSDKNGLGQIEWRRKRAAWAERVRFMFLNDLIPVLPERCRITLQMRVLEVPIRVLRELDGFTISSARKDTWEVCYDEYV